MAVGLTANTAGTMLATLSASAYAKLHTGDPGAAGTSNASAETDRKEITYTSGTGKIELTGSGTQWTSWDQGSETITHISVWDAATDGNFLFSFELDNARNVTDGDTVTLVAHEVALTPLAA